MDIAELIKRTHTSLDKQQENNILKNCCLHLILKECPRDLLICSITCYRTIRSSKLLQTKELVV